MHLIQRWTRCAQVRKEVLQKVLQRDYVVFGLRKTHLEHKILIYAALKISPRWKGGKKQEQPQRSNGLHVTEF